MDREGKEVREGLGRDRTNTREEEDRITDSRLYINFKIIIYKMMPGESLYITVCSER
jgi:hypothetical protein